MHGRLSSSLFRNFSRETPISESVSNIHLVSPTQLNAVEGHTGPKTAIRLAILGLVIWLITLHSDFAKNLVIPYKCCRPVISAADPQDVRLLRFWC